MGDGGAPDRCCRHCVCVSRAGVYTGLLINWLAGELSKDSLQALCTLPEFLFSALAVLIAVTGRGLNL